MPLMKQITKITLVAVVLGGFLLIQGCKKDSGPGESVEDVQLAKLSKTWRFSSVTLDGVDQDGYNNFVLIISGTPGSSSFGYNANGRPSTSPWPSSGPWKFGDIPETQIIRDPDTGDELDITYSVSDTQLQLTFNFSGTGFPGGRTTNVNGSWVFNLVP